MTNRTIPVHARLTEDEHRAVQEAADRDARSLGTMIRILIKEALKAREVASV